MKAKSQETQPPKELIIHGHKRIDNYYWLNERENPEVIAYLKAENDYLSISTFLFVLFQNLKCGSILSFGFTDLRFEPSARNLYIKRCI
jgi:hypothetical protein